MSGIYGSSNEDRYFENELSNYLDRDEFHERERSIEGRAEDAEYRAREIGEHSSWARFNTFLSSELD